MKRYFYRPVLERGGLFLCAFLLMGPTHAFGASYDVSLQMKEVVVTGERVPSRYEMTPSSESVITATTMENDATLQDALSQSSDVTIPAYGWMGALSGISIRGADTTQSEIMLDGIRLNNVELSGFDLSTFPLSGISSIDIVRGGMSSLYGESAMGGVLNILPDVLPASNSVAVKAMAGSFQSYHADVTAKGRVGDFGFLLSPGYESSQGDYPYIDNNGNAQVRTNNDYRGMWGLAGIGFSSGGNRAYALMHLYDSSKGVPGALGMLSPQAREHDSHGIYILKYSYTSDAVVVRTVLSHVNEDSTYFDNVYVLESSPSKSDDTDNEAGVTVSLLRIPFNIISINGDGLLQQAVSTNIGSHTRTTGSMGLEDRIQPLEWLALVGDASYQHISDIGSVVTYGIGTAVKPISWMAVKARVSTSYQAPSLDDLYWPNAAGAQGNPALKSETKGGYEAGLLLSPLSSTTIEVNGFYDRYHNLIQWSPSVNNIWMPQNISGAIIKGMELSVHSTPVRLLTLSGNMSVLSTLNLSNVPTGSYGKELTYRPDMLVNTSVKIGEGPRYVSLGIGYTGVRQITPSNSQSLPGFYTLNAVLSYGVRWVRPFVTFTQYFSNTFDTLTSYQYISGYPLPGQYVWGGIQLKIQD